MKDLKTLRAESGLTLHQLAAKSGVDFTFIHDIENHRAAMSDNAAAGLGRALGVNKEALKEAQTIAHFNHQAEKLPGMDAAALKKAAVKDTGKTAAAVMALTEVINDESLPVELRQQASKTITKLLGLKAVKGGLNHEARSYAMGKAGRRVT